MKATNKKMYDNNHFSNGNHRQRSENLVGCFGFLWFYLLRISLLSLKESLWKYTLIGCELFFVLRVLLFTGDIVTKNFS